MMHRFEKGCHRTSYDTAYAGCKASGAKVPGRGIGRNCGCGRSQDEPGLQTGKRSEGWRCLDTPSCYIGAGPSAWHAASCLPHHMDYLVDWGTLSFWHTHMPKACVSDPAL